jgi:DNA-binding NtrC family response regulator
LEHAIERAVVMADGPTLRAEDLGLPAMGEPRQPATHAVDEEDADELSLEEYFQRFVLEHQDSMSETELAQKLGISRKCLWERRQRFDLPRARSKRRA